MRMTHQQEPDPTWMNIQRKQEKYNSIYTCDELMNRDYIILQRENHTR